MAGPPPLVIKVPPPPATKGKGSLTPLDKFAKAHPSIKPLEYVIQQYAGRYGVPALWIAAVIQFESGGNPNIGMNKSGQGFGLAQINPHTWFGKPFPPTGETITQQWAAQPGNAIHFAAWYLSQGLGKYGTLQDLYAKQYNPGYKGAGPAALLKGYPKQATEGQAGTPAENAAAGAARAQAKAANLAAQEIAVKSHVDSIYLAYTGRRATQAEIANYVKNQVSDTQLQMNLGNPKLNPALYKSPLWKQKAQLYVKYYQDIFGPNAKPPQSVILHGIVFSLDETSFKNELQHDQIKGQQDYSKSEEYQSLFAQYKASYAGIYGAPDENGVASIKMAIKGGWTDTQWQNWLRNQPEYKNSAEYKTRSINLAQSMGLLTGGEAQNILAAAVPQKTPGGPAEEQPTPPATISTVSPKPTNTPPAPASPVIKPTPQGGVHVPGGTI